MILRAQSDNARVECEAGETLPNMTALTPCLLESQEACLARFAKLKTEVNAGPELSKGPP